MCKLYEDSERNSDIDRIYKAALVESKELCSHYTANGVYWIMYKNNHGGKTMICRLKTEEKK